MQTPNLMVSHPSEGQCLAVHIILQPKINLHDALLAETVSEDDFKILKQLVKHILKQPILFGS